MNQFTKFPASNVRPTIIGSGVFNYDIIVQREYPEGFIPGRRNQFVGPNLLGRLLMELRDNGKLEYNLPENALACIPIIKNN